MERAGRFQVLITNEYMYFTWPMYLFKIHAEI